MIELSKDNAIWSGIITLIRKTLDIYRFNLIEQADQIGASIWEEVINWKRFAYYSRGSLCETINWLSKSVRRNLIDKNRGEEMLAEIQILSLKLNSYIKSLKQH